jgi:hypothetical protein
METPDCRKLAKTVNSRRMANCIVSYLDSEGIRHKVEVQADSLYEAVVSAVATFKAHDCAPGDVSKIEVEMRSSVTHETSLRRVRQWLGGSAKSPKDGVTKDRLREMLKASGL